MTAAGALVLTAGLGTRLLPLTCRRAKAAVPVNGEPLVCRIVEWLVGQDIPDLVLNLHHRPETIAARVGDGSALGARVRYSWEQPVLGSAGGPRHALDLLRDPFLLVNGDTLTNVNLEELAAVHARSGAAVTMALVRNPRPEKYGGVVVSDDGWVTAFRGRAGVRPGSDRGQTPLAGGPSGEAFHFIGVQMATARVFADLTDGVPAESVGALYPRLIHSDPRSIRAFVSDATFRDIGTPDDYLRTSLALAAIEGDRLAAGTGARISESAHLERTAVWDDVTIGEGARLVECVVADGARVPARARYERCAIVPAGACDARAHERIENGLVISPF
jgi:NDP-sugar pyrophosphorylase family protein